MIKNFYQFYENSKRMDWDYRPSKLSDIEQSFLRMDVNVWPDQDLTSAKDVFDGYYGLDIPLNLIRLILEKNLDLAFECYSDGISDTCQRELLIIALGEVLGMSCQWPCYGDTNEYKQKFFAELDEKLAAFGCKRNVG